MKHLFKRPESLLSEQIIDVLHAAVQQIPELSDATREDIQVEHPSDSTHGDYATNIALKFAKKVNGSISSRGTSCSASGYKVVSLTTT